MTFLSTLIVPWEPKLSVLGRAGHHNKEVSVEAEVSEGRRPRAREEVSVEVALVARRLQALEEVSAEVALVARRRQALEEDSVGVALEGPRHRAQATGAEALEAAAHRAAHRGPRGTASATDKM